MLIHRVPYLGLGILKKYSRFQSVIIEVAFKENARF